MQGRTGAGHRSQPIRSNLIPAGSSFLISELATGFGYDLFGEQQRELNASYNEELEAPTNREQLEEALCMHLERGARFV